MDGLQKMLSIPLDFPLLVLTEAESIATSTKQCIGYLQAVENDIVLRVFSCRRRKGKSVEITEVMRRITQDERFVYKNLYGGSMQGYQAVYEKKDKMICSCGYPITVFDKDDFDVWHVRDGNAFGIWHRLVNAEMLKDTKYRYCGYRTSVCDDVIGYLNEYIKHPCVEYFGKLGIKPTPALIDKAEKDHSFRSWLYRNCEQVGCNGPKVLLYAYTHNMSIGKASMECREIDYINRTAARQIPEIRGTKLDRKKVLDYIKSKGINGHSYSDYLKALKKCKYDLTDTKNIYPYDFHRMHDLRIAEYDSVMAKENAEKEKILAENFEKNAQKAKRLEYQGECYCAIIPLQIQELVREGRELHHCVGTMGYDKKMADGEVVIVFVRSLLELEKPLITLEYSLKRKCLMQAHGDHNRALTEQERAFVDEWTCRAKEITQKKKGQR